MDLLQQMLNANYLYEFIEEFVDIIGEEKEQQAKWELYLHSPFLEKSYNEFWGEQQEERKSVQRYDKNYVDATKAKSRDILKKCKIN